MTAAPGLPGSKRRPRQQAVVVPACLPSCRAVGRQWQFWATASAILAGDTSASVGTASAAAAAGVRVGPEGQVREMFTGAEAAAAAAATHAKYNKPRRQMALSIAVVCRRSNIALTALVAPLAYKWMRIADMRL